MPDAFEQMSAIQGALVRIEDLKINILECNEEIKAFQNEIERIKEEFNFPEQMELEV